MDLDKNKRIKLSPFSILIGVLVLGIIVVFSWLFISDGSAKNIPKDQKLYAEKQQ